MSADLHLSSIDGGVVLHVRVTPRASKTKVDGIQDDGALRVRLKAPPVDGAANKALCAFLAKCLGIPERRVRIRSGERSRNKLVEVAGVSLTEIRRSLITRPT